ncbi:hypothetical protein Q8F55_000113 [Vanrija albida]|uniref:Transmembrane protein n=1 Tax=Vanrija albida TaxID=181172 RepID=A0ABR3QDA9_9TREE
MVHPLAGWAVAIVSLASVASAFTPTLEFNLTLKDTYPFLTYLPAQAWEEVFEGTPSTSYTPGMFGGGDSRHFINSTATTNSVSLSFYGKWVSFDISVDSTQQPSAAIMQLDGRSTVENYQAIPGNKGVVRGNLYYDRVDWGSHTATASFVNNSFSFYGATITTGMITQATDVNNVTFRDVPMARNAATNKAFTWTGKWDYSGTIGGGGNQVPLSVPAMVGQPGSVCSVSLPANTSFIYINGTAGLGHGSATFTLSPPPPQGFPTTVNTFNPWASTVALYFTPVDPTLQYSLSISVGQDGVLGLDTLEVYSALNDPNWALNFGTVQGQNDGSKGGGGGEHKSSSNVGAIAGGAAGGAVALLAVALVTYLVIKKRRQAKTTNVFEVDEEHAHYEPFPHSGSGVTQPLVEVTAAPTPQFTPLTEGQDAEKAYATAGGGYATTDFGSQGAPAGFWGTALSDVSEKTEENRYSTPLASPKVPAADQRHSMPISVIGLNERTSHLGPGPTSPASSHTDEGTQQLGRLTTNFSGSTASFGPGARTATESVVSGSSSTSKPLPFPVPSPLQSPLSKAEEAARDAEEGERAERAERAELQAEGQASSSVQRPHNLREEDGGRVGESDTLDTLPPEYNPEWRHTLN